jgi:hypothetical protein
MNKKILFNLTPIKEELENEDDYYDSQSNLRRRDFIFNLIWSIVNIIFFGTLFGIIALIITILIRRKHLQNMDEKAIRLTRIAYISNLIGTIYGIIFWITITVMLAVELYANWAIISVLYTLILKFI